MYVLLLTQCSTDGLKPDQNKAKGQKIVIESKLAIPANLYPERGAGGRYQ